MTDWGDEHSLKLAELRKTIRSIETRIAEINQKQDIHNENNTDLHKNCIYGDEDMVQTSLQKNQKIIDSFVDRVGRNQISEAINFCREQKKPIDTFDGTITLGT